MASNRFVCNKCRKNISEIELATAKMVRTRYDNKVHTFCPICDNHIVSINSDSYEKTLNSITRCFVALGCMVVCYYEGEATQESNIVEYHPPVFRMTDTDDRFFYRLARYMKQTNKALLEDILIIDEEDNTFSIIGGFDSWYFDKKNVIESLNKHLKILNRLIALLIKCGKKHQECV